MSDEIFELTNCIATSSINPPLSAIKDEPVDSMDELSSGAINTISDITKNIQILEALRLKHIKYSLIYNLIDKILEDNNLYNTDIGRKIIYIIRSTEVSQCLNVNSEGSDPKITNLLGLTLNKKVELTFQEQEMITDLLEIKLNETVSAIDKDLKKLCPNYADTSMYTTSVFDITLEDKIILDFNKKLNIEKELYASNLVEHDELLEEIVKLRTQTLPELCDSAIKEATVKQRLHELKSEMISTKSRVDIFTETSSTMEAYKMLMMHVVNQEENCRAEINTLIELKEKYNEASTDEFNKILQSYIQFNHSVELIKNMHVK